MVKYTKVLIIIIDALYAVKLLVFGAINSKMEHIMELILTSKQI